MRKKRKRKRGKKKSSLPGKCELRQSLWYPCEGQAQNFRFQTYNFRL